MVVLAAEERMLDLTCVRAQIRAPEGLPPSSTSTAKHLAPHFIFLAIDLAFRELLMIAIVEFEQKRPRDQPGAPKEAA